MSLTKEGGNQGNVTRTKQYYQIGKDPVGPSMTISRWGVCSRYGGDRDSDQGSELPSNASKLVE